jgi:uncharacterized protein
MIDWDVMWVATALMLVIEGIVPFLKPDAMRKALTMMAQMDDRAMRISGLASMIAGVVLLYLVKA